MQSAENGTISLQTRERLGEQLIYYRREHNLSLHDLSRMSGVDIRHIDNPVSYTHLTLPTRWSV